MNHKQGDVDDIFARIIHLGLLELNTGVVRSVVDRIKHPSFNDSGSTPLYDYMLLKLNASALEEQIYSFTSATAVSRSSNSSNSTTITIIPSATLQGVTPTTVATGLQILPLNRDPVLPQSGDILRIMGFGVTDENGYGLVDALRQASVYAVNNGQCGNMYGGAFDAEVMLCAGVPNGEADTCYGDSGGPLINDVGVQVGIVSWGDGCGTGYPGVYSRVSTVVDWIDEEICKNSCFPPDTCDASLVHPCANSTSPIDSSNGPVEPATEAGSVSIKISITMDDFPGEVGAIFEEVNVNSNSTTELWYMGYGTYSRYDVPDYGNLVVNKTFEHLSGGIYHLILGDQADNGICW